MSKLSLTAALAALALCASCESETPYFDSQLGKSAANLVKAQTLDRATAAHPAALAPEGADGQRIRSAVEQYHKDVPKEGETVKRQVTFEAGK
jgi:hypothetical protein